MNVFSSCRSAWKKLTAINFQSIAHPHKSTRSPRKSFFPHGFSATEPLVPPSLDGSTPLTDALPRSILLDPREYKSKIKHRENPPSKEPEISLTEFEQRIMENPFAKILASPVREDNASFRSLPRDFLLKFSIFRHSESGNYWILPSNIPPFPKNLPNIANRGVYRLNNKLAIDELGFRTRNKKWQFLVAPGTSDRVRKNLVWRDGMSDYILEVLRHEAWKRLDGLPRKFLLQASLDEGLSVATLGRRLQKRNEHEKGDTFRVTHPLPSAEGGWTLPAGEQRILKEDSQPHISAILHLPGPEARYTWEFRSIKILNQSTLAVIFNVRRLFPLFAEKYFAHRLETGNTIAVESCVMSAVILRHMLRLSFYIEGDDKVDVSLETTKCTPPQDKFIELEDELYIGDESRYSKTEGY